MKWVYDYLHVLNLSYSLLPLGYLVSIPSRYMKIGRFKDETFSILRTHFDHINALTMFKNDNRNPANNANSVIKI